VAVTIFKENNAETVKSVRSLPWAPFQIVKNYQQIIIKLEEKILVVLVRDPILGRRKYISDFVGTVRDTRTFCRNPQLINLY
jgi:hypothetical protein